MARNRWVPSERRRRATLTDASRFLLAVALTAGLAGCGENVFRRLVVRRASFVTASTVRDEGAGAVSVSVRLSARAIRPVQLALGVSGTATSGDDYTIHSTLVEIPKGQREGTVRVDLREDALDEDAESIVLTLLSAKHAKIAYKRGIAQHVISVSDNDPEPEVAFEVAEQYRPEVAGTVGVVVALSAPSGRQVSVGYGQGPTSTAVQPADFTLDSALAVFEPGQTQASIAVVIVEDDEAEGTEDLVLELGRPTHAVLGQQRSHTLRILDAKSLPAVIAAQTLDADGDGHLDHYRLTFSKPLDDATFAGYQSDSVGTAQSIWTVAGRTAVVLAHGAAAPEEDRPNDGVLYLRFEEALAFDTGHVPDLTTQGTPRLLAIDGTAVVPLDGPTTLTERDGAPPVLVSAVTEAGSTELVLAFSEPVVPAGPEGAGQCPGDLITPEALTYESLSSPDGVTELVGTSDGDGCDSRITVTADADFVAADLGSDRVAVAPGAVADLAGLSARQGAVLVSGLSGASVVSAETLDVNADGHLDHFRITFSGPVVDATFPGFRQDARGDAQPWWQVAGYPGAVLVHGSVAPGLDTTDDEVIYLGFDPSGSYDTGLLPDLICPTSSGLLAHDGGPVATIEAADVTEHDGARPVLLAAVTTVGSDALTVTFSEGVSSSGLCGSGGTFDASALLYSDGGGAVSSLSGTGLDACGGQATMQADASFDDGDLSLDTVAPTTSVVDAAGNVAASASVAVSGASALRLTAAETMDGDGDGHIDGYRLTFSKPVVDSSFPGFVADAAGSAQSDWLVQGRAGVALVHGAAAPEPDESNDATIYLAFDPSDAFDTHLTPELTTSQTPRLLAFDGTALDPLADADLAEQDRAAPVLVAAVARSGFVELALSFSESVYGEGSAGCPGGEVAASHIQYTDAGGVGVAALRDGADSNGCDGRISVAASAGTFGAVDLGVDTVTPLSMAIFDAADNAARAEPVTVITEAGSLVLLAAETLDADGNGQIDHYRLSFNERVDDRTFSGYRADALGTTQSAWRVAGYGNVALAHGAAAPEPDVPNDSVLYLRFGELGILDTDALPELTTGASPQLRAHDGDPLAPLGVSDVAESDGAAPVLVTAVVELGAADLTLTFSEGVAASAPCSIAGTLSASDFVYTPGSGNVTSVSGTAVDACSGQVILLGNGAYGVDDLLTDGIAPKASIVDNAGNSAVGASALIGEGVAPWITDVATLDADHDGVLDHVQVTFSKPVTDATFPGYVGDGVGGGQTAWNVVGRTGVVLAHGTAAPETDTHDDDTLYLRFAGSGAYDTARLLALTTTASPGLRAFDGAPLAQVVVGSYAQQDRAAPVLVSAVTQAGLAALTVTFSEGVSSGVACSAGGTVDATDFVYDDAGGAGSHVTGVTGTSLDACGGQVTLLGNRSFEGSLDLGADRIAAGATLRDEAGNVAVGSAVVNGTAAPGVTAVQTLDADGNGHLDHVRVTCSMAVNDSTFPGYVEDGLGNPQSAWLVLGYAGVVLAHGASAPTHDIPNDTVLYLRFDETGGYDTGALPELTTTFTPTLEAFDGSLVAPVGSATVTEIDAAPPILVAAIAQVGATRLTVTFSEPVAASDTCGNGGTVSIADFAYSSGQGVVNGVVAGTDLDACDGQITLTADAQYVAYDLVEDAIAPLDTLTDEAGNAALGGAAVVGAIIPPAVLCSVTLDADADGHLDHYRITFNKPLNDATFPGYVANDVGAQQSDWRVAGRGGVVLAHGLAAPEADVPNDSVLYLRFTEQGVFDTGLLPSLTASPTPGLEAFDGAPLDPLASGDAGEADGAAPLLVTAAAVEGSAELRLTFSEGVGASETCANGGTVSETDFVYTSDGGSVDSVSGTQSACSGQMVLTGDNPFALGDLGSDTIAAKATIQDDAGNVALGGAVPVGQREPPTLSSAETLDADADGRIDHYRITFSKPMDDATFPGYAQDALGSTQSEWLVAGYTGVVLAHGAAAPMADTPNDEILFLAFEPAGAFDTGVIPELTTAADPDLRAFDGSSPQTLAPGDLDESDGAPPVLVSATADAGSADLTITFSEGVSASDLCSDGGTVDVEDFHYEPGVGSVSSLSGTGLDACDGQTVVQGDVAFDVAAINSASVAASSSIRDQAGHEARGVVRLLSAVVEVTVVSATTVDGDHDGRVDHYRLSLSKEVRDETFPGYQLDGPGDVQSEWLVQGRTHVRLAHGAAAPEADTPNDDTLYLRFDPVGSFDTSARPDLSSTSTPGVFAFDGAPALPLTPGTATLLDGAAPVLLAAVTQEGLTALTVTFSEAVASVGTCGSGPATVEASDFTYTSVGGGVDGVTGTALDACSGQLVLQGNAAFTAGDLGVDTLAPRDVIEDAAGNSAVGSVLVSGESRPTVSRAETLDVDADGQIDHYRLTFSKPVQDASFPGYVANGSGNGQGAWSVAGRTGVALAHGDAAPVADLANDEVLYLRFDPSGSYDTDATPEVTTSLSPGLLAYDGAALAPLGLGDVTEQDAAPPMLVAALAEEGGAEITLTFTEPVFGLGTGGCPGGTVDEALFEYYDPAPSDVTGLKNGPDASGCDGRLTLAAASGTFTSGDIGVDQVRPTADVLDGADNPARADSVSIEGLTRPTPSHTDTGDRDGNGRIDFLRVTFSKSVDDSTFPGYVGDGTGAAQTDWFVQGYAGVALAHGAAAPEADTADDNVLYLTFVEGPDLDTDATPELWTTATPELVATDGATLEEVPRGSLATTDAAPPVLVLASADSGSAHLSLVFSEPVTQQNQLCDAPGIPPSYFAYQDSGSGSVTDLATAAHEANGCDDSRVVLVAASAATFSAGDLYNDRIVFPSDGSDPTITIYDRADPANEALAANVLIRGVIHPFVLNVVSTGLTQLRITYSEPVDVAAATLSANYAYTVVDSGCGDSDPQLVGAAATAVSETTYLFETSVQVSACRYRLEVTGPVTDLDEGASLTDPKLGTFDGNASLRVVSAQARSLRTVLVELSKDVLVSDPAGGTPLDETTADNPSLYTLPAALGTVIDAQGYRSVTGSDADKNKILITHSLDQGAAFYSVVVATTLQAEVGGETLSPAPFDRTTFQGLGGSVENLDEGALFEDPFGDGTTFSFVFAHRDKIYVGPNDGNNAVFRFDPDGSNPVTVTFQIATEGTSDLFSTFGNNVTRPAHEVAVQSTAPAVTRYFVTPDTDLSWVTAGTDAVVQGCQQVDNDAGAAAVVGLSDDEDWVDLDVAGQSAAAETCRVTLYDNAGPGSASGFFDGVDAFVSVTLHGADYLAFGAHNEGGGGGFPEMYLTADPDTVLDLGWCSVNSQVTVGNTRSLQMIFSDLDELYFGFASDSASRQPILGHSRLVSSDPDAWAGCTAESPDVVSPNKGAEYVPYIGNKATPNANTATNIGIDSMAVFTDTHGTRLFIANNGGIVATADRPLSGASVWSVVSHDGATEWAGTTTKPIPHIGKLRPGEKGIPFMVEWDGHLFVARNRDDDEAEVWRYSPAGAWSLVADTSSSNGMNSLNTAVSMIVVSGDRLYIGFDNATDGAEVYRTDGVTAAADLPGGATDVNLGFAKLGESGLGPVGATDLVLNKHIISHVSAFHDGVHYLYVTVGCTSDFRDNGDCDRNGNVAETDFAIRMFRQVD